MIINKRIWHENNSHQQRDIEKIGTSIAPKKP
ncbi:MAG: hypothetical protein ACJA19_000934, partial [Bacteroidia bacterium]